MCAPHQAADLALKGFLILLLSGLACGDDNDGEGGTAPPAEPIDCGIDVHQHLASNVDFEVSAANLIDLMDELGIAQSLLLPPPVSGNPSQATHYTYTDLTAVIAEYPGRLGLIGGGKILNRQIHALVISGRSPTTEELDAFEADARAIAANGVAGFGEMAILHLSYRASHPFIAIPADHPMYLRLADVAAEVGLPIDIHLELVVEDVPLPDSFEPSPEGNNPAELLANLPAFETLLSHNRDARIMWVHGGWDNIGHMTTSRIETLLSTHPNLFVALKILDEPGPVQVAENRPLDANGTIRPEWLTLLTTYPSRFVLGADEFIGAGDPEETTGAPSTRGTWSLLDQLPEETARQIACLNPPLIYRLN